MLGRMLFAGCHHYQSFQCVFFFPVLLIAMWMEYFVRDRVFSWVYYNSIVFVKLSLEYQFLYYSVGLIFSFKEKGDSRLGEFSGQLLRKAILATSISIDNTALSMFRSCQILSMKPPKAIVDPTDTLGFLPSPHFLDSTK